MKPIRILGLLVFGACMLVVLLSMQTPRSAFADSMAYWRLVHAAPDITSADIFVDGTKLVSNFQYATVSGYSPTPAGTHKIQVAIIGQSIGAALMTQYVTVKPGVPYTLAILGTKSSGYSLGVFVDDNSIDRGLAKIRAYDLSPNTGALNIAVNNNTVVSNLVYQHASDYFTEPVGSYTFNVTATQQNTIIPTSTTLNKDSLTSIFTIGMLTSMPNFQLVTAQTTFIPSMPQTGSDPHIASSATPYAGVQALTSWLVGGCVLLAISAWLLVCQRKNAHKHLS